MKREVTTDEPNQTVREPAVSPTHEREFSQGVVHMVDLMSSLFKSQTIGELNRGTIDKFQDAQTGNYARVFLTLAAKSKRGLLQRFDDKRIEAMTRQMLGKIDRRSKDIFYNDIEKKIGINADELAKQEGLKFNTNALMAETEQWVKKLRDDTIEEYTANTLRLMSLGEPLSTIEAEYDKLTEKRRGHAKFTAFNQTQNFNALVTKSRVQNLGIQKAIWRTSKDEAVRPSHKQRDGKEFDLRYGLYSSIDGKKLLPATDFRCRCYAEYIIPEA